MNMNQKEIIKFYNNLLSKHLTLREFTSIDFNNISFYNNKNLTIRAVGCPYLYKEGSVVYIFKSSKEDKDDYVLVKEIENLDVGKFGYSINMVLDSSLKYRNVLVVSSYSKTNKILKTYIYNNVFGKELNLNIIRNDISIEIVDNVKLILSKNKTSIMSLLILIKGKNKNDDNIIKCWERYKLNIKPNIIKCKFED